jgi:hypothetical protein
MLQPQKTQKKGAICGFIVHDVSYGAVAATLNGLGPFESCQEWNHITSIELGNKFLERSPSFFLLHHNSMLDAFPYDSYYSTHLAFFHGHFFAVQIQPKRQARPHEKTTFRCGLS